MGRRHEEKVDVEELARLENPEDGSTGKIRVKMPNRRINEMFALADQILGGRRVSILCEDGETRLARIPGKMRRRQWVREGDLIIVWPWDFQDSKADVKHRYTKTQAMYLSRKGALPDDVDIFGMNVTPDEDDEHDDIFGVMDAEEDDVVDDSDDDVDAMFGDFDASFRDVDRYFDGSFRYFDVIFHDFDTIVITLKSPHTQLLIHHVVTVFVTGHCRPHPCTSVDSYGYP